MTTRSFYRSVLADRIFLWGWILLAVVGQAVLPFKAPALEWIAVGWITIGLWTVRSSACLPLLILTGPLFMCSPHHRWAWALATWAMVFLLRLLSEKRCGRKEFLWIAFWGTLILAFSWPEDSGPLFLGMKKFEPGELLIQWFRPDASWAIFPFRHSFDRALVAGLATALIMIPGYIKTTRLWRSLFGAGIMALGATYAAAILPWQQPHDFLGSVNVASVPGFLFYGAGHEPPHLAFILAATLPWFLAPLHARHSWAHLGLLPLFIPTAFLNERVYILGLVAVGLTFVLLTIMSVASPRGRIRLRARGRACFRQRHTIFAIATGSLLIAALWSFRLGILEPQSPLRTTICRWTGQTESVWVKATPYGKPAETRLATTESSGGGVQPKLSFIDRLEIRLSQVDPARANMWAMGIKHSWKEGFWLGSGAGTWAHFHRGHRITRLYFAHMHNTYLNLIFEYGVVPMMLIYLLVAFLVVRLLRGVTGQPRAWILYLAGLSALGMGFDLFYFPLSLFGLVLVGVIVLAKAWQDTGSDKRSPYKVNP